MSTKLCLMAADFRTSLATELAVSGTSCTLQSITDDDGVTLPNGTYMFTLDLENSQKEHFVATLTGTSLSAMSSISRQGVQTSGAVRKHRIGASVTMTDFAHIMYMNNLLKGVTDLNASVPLKYDGVATLTPGSNELCTVAYADALTFAGAPNASATQKGIVEIATAAEVGAGTGTGGTGAILVISPTSTAKTSSGAGDENKVPVLNASGVLASGFLDAARTWGTVQSFTANNAQITTDADSANDAVRLSYAQTLIPQGAISGTSGEAITAGQAVYLKASDSKLWLTDADADESTFSFVGIALTTVAAADLAVTYAPPGHTVTGLAGLVAGSQYFLSGTAGAIDVTPGARFARIGIAVSTTALLVTLPKYKVSGTQSITSATTFVQTVGFYPGKISIRAAGAEGGGAETGASIGDDTNACIAFKLVGATNNAAADATLAWWVYDKNAASTRSAGTVSAKSATGFTLNCSTYAATVTVQWTAESL